MDDLHGHIQLAMPILFRIYISARRAWSMPRMRCRHRRVAMEGGWAADANWPGRPDGGFMRSSSSIGRGIVPAKIASRSKASRNFKQAKTNNHAYDTRNSILILACSGLARARLLAFFRRDFPRRRDLFFLLN